MVPLARDDDDDDGDGDDDDDGDGDDDEGDRWKRLEDDRSQTETDN